MTRCISKEASTAFVDPLSVTIFDPDHSEDEQRFILLGRTYTNRLVVVVHTERGPAIRIIVLAPDVAEVFKTSKVVNDALRTQLRQKTARKPGRRLTRQGG